MEPQGAFVNRRYRVPILLIYETKQNFLDLEDQGLKPRLGDIRDLGRTQATNKALI
jgi:hypothetical protein